MTSFEQTPNPDAIKCAVDGTLSTTIRSYFNATQANEAGDELAIELFGIQGVRSLLIHNTFVSVNREPGAPWGPIKKSIETALARRDPVA
ncbi:MAG: NifU N-terminal domain-containing protein [Planctomycetota bacterium]